MANSSQFIQNRAVYSPPGGSIQSQPTKVVNGVLTNVRTNRPAVPAYGTTSKVGGKK